MSEAEDRSEVLERTRAYMAEIEAKIALIEAEAYIAETMGNMGLYESLMKDLFIEKNKLAGHVN